jgi:hypothetical protein
MLRRVGFRRATGASPSHRLSLLLYDLEPVSTERRLPGIAGWRPSMLGSDEC